MKAASNYSVSEGPERLSPLDISNLRTEDHGLPMHVAALAYLPAEPLLDTAGQLRLEEIREHVERGTHQGRRLRQILTRPRFGLGPPFWTEDTAFDIALHVNFRPLPAPGDEATLLTLCAELNKSPLSRSRPLWEMWLLTGLTGNRVALLIRLHHAVADGMAAVNLLAALFDVDSRQEAPDTLDEKVRPLPADWQVFTDNVRHQGLAFVSFLSHLAHPAHLAVLTVTAARQIVSLARAGLAPTTSLNRPVGHHRLLLLFRTDLASTKAIAREHGAKLTDVLLAAYAGGALQLLQCRQELVPGLELKVSVAASLRGRDETMTGNRVGIRIVPIPVGGPDAVCRLHRITEVRSAQATQPPYQPGGRLLQRWMVRVMFHQRLVNLLLSNLPGPPEPEIFPLASACSPTPAS